VNPGAGLPVNVVPIPFEESLAPPAEGESVFVKITSFCCLFSIASRRARRLKYPAQISSPTTANIITATAARRTTATSFRAFHPSTALHPV
jgi:hypothetical protein